MRCQSVIRPGPHRLRWSTSLICDPSTEDQTETMNEGCEYYGDYYPRSKLTCFNHMHAGHVSVLFFALMLLASLVPTTRQRRALSRVSPSTLAGRVGRLSRA